MDRQYLCDIEYTRKIYLIISFLLANEHDKSHRCHCSDVERTLFCFLRDRGMKQGVFSRTPIFTPSCPSRFSTRKSISTACCSPSFSIAVSPVPLVPLIPPYFPLPSSLPLSLSLSLVLYLVTSFYFLRYPFGHDKPRDTLSS